MRASARSIAVPTLLLLLVAAMVYAAPPGAQHDPMGSPAPRGTMPGGAPANTGPLALLTHQIQAMRDEMHQQLDPLQAQVKALHEKYDPQLKGLDTQRHDLIESGKPQNIQDLDAQQDRDLASLADQEKADVDKVRQGYAEKRTALQADYESRRKAFASAAH